MCALMDEAFKYLPLSCVSAGGIVRKINEF
jgi:hypothetical protein